MFPKRNSRAVLSIDFRELIVRKIIHLGGNIDLKTVPRGVFAALSLEMGVRNVTVKRIWNDYCTNKGFVEVCRNAGRKPKLEPDIANYVDFLIKEKPSMSLGDIREKLDQVCGLKISKQTICRYLKKTVTRKILVRPAADRFTPHNLQYMQAFLDVLHAKDVTKIKFFDESGFALPDVSNPKYGRARKGERAIEVMDNKRTPNKTLNLLIGFHGVCYANVLPGPSDTDSYVQFFIDAVNATTNTGDFALKPGDFVVVDNCPIHHNRAENLLTHMLDRIGIEYIFTPTYSPNLNPVELCFNHIKTMFKREQIRHAARDNLDYAIMHCVNVITPSDCAGYFREVGYLQT